MGKYFGKIGYGESVETAPGVWREIITEKEYFLDITRNYRRMEGGSQVISDINISNEISIIADPYAQENFHMMKYVEFMGTKWKILTVEVQYPRLILTAGGVWNEQK